MCSYRFFCILFLITLISACGSHGEEFEIVSINDQPKATSHPININACIPLDLNFDNSIDLELCHKRTVTNGGLNIDHSFLHILNNELRIAATETTDSIHRCCVDQNDILFPTFCQFMMSKFELNCPDDGEYNVEPTEQQNYPTIFDNINNIYVEHNSVNDDLVLSYSDLTSDPSQTKELRRTYWKGTLEKYIIFEIPKNGQMKKGWIKVSDTFVHSIGLQKD